MLGLGQYDEGRPLLAEADAGAGPKDVGAIELYAAGLAEHLIGNQAEARRDFQRALEANPSYWQARVELDRLTIRR